MLKRIVIEGLFSQFNYNIELKNEGITILTGPNGYGKTTILKIIYAYAIKNLAFFFQLPFEKIELIQEASEIVIQKTDNDTIIIKGADDKPSSYNKKEIINKEFKRFLDNASFRQLDENRWIDRRSDVIYTTENLMNLLIENFPDIQDKHYKKSLPAFVDVYLIKEQRLLRKLPISRRRPMPYYFDEEIKESFGNTVEEYAKELSKKLNEILANASKIGQELDSSFPRRLFDATVTVAEADFNNRYNQIKEKQKSLSLYGLSTTKEDTQPSFKTENAKALFVYLDDQEKKLSVFNEVLKKLEIFSTILNERRFAFKKLEISPESGFKFKTETGGSDLSLTDLSSGEQQEVVLLYELLFRVKPNTLVLIDEPEISLHVAWQKEFLNDLLKIIKLQDIKVITATHSPQIINTHGDLEVDLEDISK